MSAIGLNRKTDEIENKRTRIPNSVLWEVRVLLIFATMCFRNSPVFLYFIMILHQIYSVVLLLLLSNAFDIGGVFLYSGAGHITGFVKQEFMQLCYIR